jgi:hypothetical protein
LQSIFGRHAYGEDMLQCKSAGGELPGFLQIELSGGWNAVNSFAMGNQRDGSAFAPLSLGAYAAMGLGPNLAPTDPTRIDERLGGRLIAGGPFLRGFLTAVTPEAMTKMSVAIMAAISGDDRPTNLLNVTQLAASVVNAGKYKLIDVLGNGQNEVNSFGFSRLSPATIQRRASGRILSPQNAVEMFDPGLLASRLSRDSVARISQGIRSMSEGQLKKFQSKAFNQQLMDLVSCGYIGAGELLQGVEASRVDARQDPVITSLSGNVLGNTSESQVATIAKLLTDGMAASATFMPGQAQLYDYHARQAAQQVALSEGVGRFVGIAMQIAHMKGAPLFVAITSDGSASASSNAIANPDTGLTTLTAEDESRATTVMLAINGGNPGAAGTRPKMNHHQIGAFNASGAVDVDYLKETVTTPEMHSWVLVANYAAFAGRMAEFRSAMTALKRQDFIQDKVPYLAFKS